jgi:hypothetical protein
MLDVARNPFWVFFQAVLLLGSGTFALAQGEAVTYGYSFVPPAPATGAPEILKIELNSDDLRAGGPIAIRVTTAPDVTEVVTGNGRHHGSLTRASAGIFTSSSTLPHIGGLMHVHIKLHFTATTADGREAEADVPVVYK